MYTGIHANATHAKLCYERAALNGNVHGMERLAVMLIGGKEKDHERADQLMHQVIMLA